MCKTSWQQPLLKSKNLILSWLFASVTLRDFWCDRSSLRGPTALRLFLFKYLIQCGHLSKQFTDLFPFNTCIINTVNWTPFNDDNRDQRWRGEKPCMEIAGTLCPCVSYLAGTVSSLGVKKKRPYNKFGEVSNNQWFNNWGEGVYHRKKTGRDNKMSHALKKAASGQSLPLLQWQKISLELAPMLYFITHR